MGNSNAWSLERLAAGEDLAWEGFLREYNPLIESVTTWSKWHFAPETRQDVAQKIRAELQKALAGFKGDASLEYFVKRICIRRCIDQVRIQARENERYTSATVLGEDGTWNEIDHAAPEEDNPVRLVMARERALLLRDLVGQLEPFCVDVIEGFYLEEKKYQQIAQEQEVSINTVSSRLSRCLARLRALAAESGFFRE